VISDGVSEDENINDMYK